MQQLIILNYAAVKQLSTISNYLKSTTTTNYYCYTHHYILLLNLITLIATRTVHQLPDRYLF